MEVIPIYCLLSSVLLLCIPCIIGESSLSLIANDNDEFSSCSILKSKYEILKLRLEITEKFGHYVPEIDEKLKALELKFEKLYHSIKSQQNTGILQNSAKLSIEGNSEIPTPAALAQATECNCATYTTDEDIQSVTASNEKIYFTNFTESEDPKACKSHGNDTSVCYNLQLPNTCTEPDGLTCLNNKCRIRVDGVPSFMVPCNNDWIIIQRRINGSVDFNRSWADYKHGFGDMNGEFWLGLEKIHALTSSHTFELRVEIEDDYGDKKYARYNRFLIGAENGKYALQLLSPIYGEDGASPTLHEGTNFFTFYEDDTYENNDVYCAGGWWFYECDSWQHNNNPNGKYYDDLGIIFKSHGYEYFVKFTQMSIRKIE